MVDSLQRLASIDQVRAARKILEEGGVGNRGVFDGDEMQQLFGMQCQIIIADLLGVPRPSAKDGFDGGVDVAYNGKKWDVKVVIRNTNARAAYGCNVPESQTTNNYEADGYIFASYNKNTGLFEILGWITKEDFLKKAKHHPKGSRVPRSDGSSMIVKYSFYDVRIKDLHRIRTEIDLKGVGRT